MHHPTKDQADDHGRAEKTEIDLDVASGLGASPEVHGRGSRLSGVALRERKSRNQGRRRNSRVLPTQCCLTESLCLPISECGARSDYTNYTNR